MSTGSGSKQATQACDDTALLMARELLYRFFAIAFRGPHEPIWEEGKRAIDPRLVRFAAHLVQDSADRDDARGFADSASGVAETIRTEAKETLQKEYDRVFGLLVPKECPPYETEYLRAGDAFQRAQVMADAAGFYRAFGLKPARKAPERPDHIALMCEFMAIVLLKQRHALEQRDQEHAQVCAEAAEKFFKEHLSWWVPSFTSGLARKAGNGFYHDLATTFDTWIRLECRFFGVSLPDSPPRAELIERPEEAGGCFSCPLAS